jgi:undecaprenyl diphosphate synthase
MDGNRRWAKARFLPVALGHAAGARRVREVVQACSNRGVRFITLFAFSTENWQRPADEVSSLMGLLALYLNNEVKNMRAMGVRFKVAGDVSKFDPRIQALIEEAQASTAHNTTITLTVAVNYGGRQDIVQAVQAWQNANPNLAATDITESGISQHLGLAHAPDPDLMIRTGGESRISNFLLWQMAYTEMCFSNVLWPSFSEKELDSAITWYRTCERRFGGAPVELAHHA